MTITHRPILTLILALATMIILTGHANAQTLKPGYVATFVTQIADGVTTEHALQRGAVERNPLMRAITKTPLRLYSFKVAQAAGINLAVHSLSKTHRHWAFIVQTAINSAYLTIAVHNSKTMVKR